MPVELPTNGTWQDYAVCVEPMTGTEPSWLENVFLQGKRV